MNGRKHRAVTTDEAGSAQTHLQYCIGILFSVIDESEHSDTVDITPDHDQDFATRRSVRAIRKRLLKVEGRVTGLTESVTRELTYNRRKNLLFFQLPLSDSEKRDKVAAKETVATFIDDHIMIQKGWAAPRIKNAFRLAAKFGVPPLLAVFGNGEDVFAVLGNCNKLASYNAALKRKGARPVSVRRHYDEITSKRIQHLTNLQRAIRSNPRFAGVSTSVKEQVKPYITIDGVSYEVENIPDQYKALVPKFDGL